MFIIGKGNEEKKVTEKEESSQGAGEGGVEEAAGGEVEAGVPFRIQIVRWQCIYRFIPLIVIVIPHLPLGCQPNHQTNFSILNSQFSR